MKEQKWALLALASIPLLMTLGNSMFIPVLPVIEKELNITPFESSLIITSYSFIAILLIPIAGYLSDHFGRKKVIVPSLILVGIGGIVCGWSSISLEEPYTLIMIGRVLQGAGAAGAFPVVIPTVGDLFKNEKDISAGLGIIETANTFGKVLSPILGALLALWVWYIPFWSVPILSSVAVLLMVFLVKTPAQESKPKQFSTLKKSVKKSFHQNGRWLIAIFLIGGNSMFVLFGFLVFFSSALESVYKIEGILKGVYLSIPLLGLCIASYVTGKGIGENKHVMKWIIILGSILTSISLFFMLIVDALMMTLIVLTFAGFGIGIVLPCLDAFITENIEKEERGTITSFYSSMRFIGVALGPPIVSLLLKSSDSVVYITLASVNISGILLALLLIKPNHSNSYVKASSS